MKDSEMQWQTSFLLWWHQQNEHFPQFSWNQILKFAFGLYPATSSYSLQCHVLELKSESSSVCWGWMWALETEAGRRRAVYPLFCAFHSVWLMGMASSTLPDLQLIWFSQFMVPISNRISRVRFLVRNSSWKFRLVYLCFIFKSYLFFSLLN